jgi:hypothetical protein
MASDRLHKISAPPVRVPGDGRDLRSEISLDELERQLTLDAQRALLRYWNSIRHYGRLPARSDFDPLSVARILGHFRLIDIVEPGPMFRYPLIESSLRLTAKGQRDGQFIGDGQTTAYAAYLSCVCELPYRFRKPVFIRERAEFEDGKTTVFARLLLPLARDHNSPDMLLVSVMPDPDSPREQVLHTSAPQRCFALSMVLAKPLS